MMFALYARVSSERQQGEQTIESQLGALRERAREKGYEIDERHVYIEESPGGRLDRPQLGALRDDARDGQFEGVLICERDRLARRFADQEIVIEELARYGTQVEFIERPISDNLEDRMLVLLQGALTEYGHERTRRGLLFKARQGMLVASHAPYGYRYVTERDGVPAHLEIDPEEAEGVRQVFEWFVNEELSSRTIAERLCDSRWETRRGGPWRGSTVRHILANECYTGRRYYNKTQSVEPKERRNACGHVERLKSSSAMRPREEWIETPVPRLISDETFKRAQDELKACRHARCGRTAHSVEVDD